jgi:steroid delta-isomerase-like uncharacterized protein
MSGGLAKRSKGIKENENKALVREFFAAIDKGELDKVRNLLSADFAFYAPALPKPWGAEEILQDIRRFYTAFPGSTHVIDDLISEGDKVAVRLNQYGTHRAEFEGIAATGKQIKVAGTHIVRSERGRIMEFWALEDILGQMQQLGMELKPKRG